MRVITIMVFKTVVTTSPGKCKSRHASDSSVRVRVLCFSAEIRGCLVTWFHESHRTRDFGLTTQSPKLATRQDIRLAAPVCATTVDEFSVKNLGLSSVRWSCASSSALLCVTFARDASGAATVPATVAVAAAAVALVEFHDGGCCCTVVGRDTVGDGGGGFSAGCFPFESGTELCFPSPVVCEKKQIRNN